MVSSRSIYLQWAEKLGRSGTNVAIAARVAGTGQNADQGVLDAFDGLTGW